ncbi:MAG: 50S ribosomal protein L29 [Flavobacteriales bacterium Tduv]
MIVSKIRELSIQEIRETLKVQKEEYQKMKFNHGIISLKTPIELRHIRKNIARLATILREKSTE